MLLAARGELERHWSPVLTDCDDIAVIIPGEFQLLVVVDVARPFAVKTSSTRLQFFRQDDQAMHWDPTVDSSVTCPSRLRRRR